LLNRDVDVIGGLYPMKTLPIKWVVNGFEGAKKDPMACKKYLKLAQDSCWSSAMCLKNSMRIQL
jgi:hypothetical protein